jgi:hypothetical protein
VTFNCCSSTCAYLTAVWVLPPHPRTLWLSNRHSSWKDNFWSIKPYFTSMQYITKKRFPIAITAQFVAKKMWNKVALYCTVFYFIAHFYCIALLLLYCTVFYFIIHFLCKRKTCMQQGLGERQRGQAESLSLSKIMMVQTI